MILSLPVLVLLIMFIQWLFFSYDDDDFNIPESYFDRMYENEEIDSEENGLTEYVAYLKGIVGEMPHLD
ncbi:MAG: hypothetical protein LBC61_01655 [Candidatus Peribacteria bacterium]|jgi:hypothetical protein|nr:hypothetical protein [Candidatus Peribacteria bacterium]